MHFPWHMPGPIKRSASTQEGGSGLGVLIFRGSHATPPIRDRNPSAPLLLLHCPQSPQSAAPMVRPHCPPSRPHVAPPNNRSHSSRLLSQPATNHTASRREGETESEPTHSSNIISNQKIATAQVGVDRISSQGVSRIIECGGWILCACGVQTNAASLRTGHTFPQTVGGPKEAHKEKKFTIDVTSIQIIIAKRCRKH